MEVREINVKLREKLGKGEAKRLRKKGLTPGIIYGGDTPIPIVFNPKELSSALKTEYRQNTILKLKFENREVSDRLAILKDYQVDPVMDTLVHADFYEITEDKEMLIDIPIKIEGIPPGVRKGGIMQWTMRRLRVKCTPRSLMSAIKIDVSNLEVGQSIHIEDITLPDGITVVMDKTLPVVTITEVVEEKPEEVPEEEIAAEEKPPEEKEAEKKEEKEKEKEK